ncbi:hypothetical protein V5S96_03470 [Corynebacterium mastitidis]|uniref:Uncharacterized protein n=1 Tax=Corynebacterium mastitidis TaxID=161890 RepID=A0ABU8NWM9_9CORY
MAQHVRNASDVIDRNILVTSTDRGFLSQNILSQLRNLVEGLIVYAHVTDRSVTYNVLEQFSPALDVAKSDACYQILTRFHAMLQISTSHYTSNPDGSERLMLKYYEYLIRIRDLAKRKFGLYILRNLERFPLHEDAALRFYYEKIAERVESLKNEQFTGKTERY